MIFEAPNNIAFAGYADDNTPYTYSFQHANCANQSSKKQQKKIPVLILSARMDVL